MGGGRDKKPRLSPHPFVPLVSWSPLSRLGLVGVRELRLQHPLGTYAAVHRSLRRAAPLSTRHLPDLRLGALASGRCLDWLHRLPGLHDPHARVNLRLPEAILNSFLVESFISPPRLPISPICRTPLLPISQNLILFCGVFDFSTQTTHFSHMSHTPFRHISECDSVFFRTSNLSRWRGVLSPDKSTDWIGSVSRRHSSRLRRSSPWRYAQRRSSGLSSHS